MTVLAAVLAAAGLLALAMAAPALAEISTKRLFEICRSGTVAELEAALAAGAEVNAVDERGQTALMAVVANQYREGDAAKVELLLRAGADAGLKDESGRGVLHYLASWYGPPDLIRTLAAAGADAASADKDGRTPLGFLIDNYPTAAEEARALLEAGADPNRKGYLAMTPLHGAAPYGSPEMIEVLLAAGAEVDAVDERGRTPLMGLDFSSNSDWEKNLAKVAILLKAGADPDRKDEFGRAVLHNAAADGGPLLVRVLAEGGADVNVLDDEGQTPLMLLNKYRHDQARDLVKAEILLKAGADPRLKSRSGHTVLHAAASGGNLDLARMLVAAGADVNAATEDGRTPLMNLPWGYPDEDDPEAVPLLAELLLEAGADVKPKDKQGRTALFHAVDDGRPDLMAKLLAAGAEIDVADENGWTPLAVACKAIDKSWPDGIQEAMVKLLLDSGASIEPGISAKGYPAAPLLMKAAKDSGPEVIKMLLAAGCPVDGAASWGTTPLMNAAWISPYPESVRLLLAAGADVSLRNNNGWTALDFARDNETPAAGEILQLLEAAQK